MLRRASSQWLVSVAAAMLLVAASLAPRAQDAPPAPAAAPAGQAPGQPGGRGAVQPGGRGPAIGSRGGQMVGDPANADVDFSPKPPIVALPPEEQKKHFILPPGYTVDLVLDDRHVISPAALAFDGDGRMYVAEMRTFMRDQDATGQLDRLSRVSMHESTKKDGVYDRHTVFVDNLLLPRMILPLDKGILVNETHLDDLVLYTDTNGDGIADKRQVFYTGIGSNRDGNVQHEQSGLIWGLDNWIYTTYNAFRFRWTPAGIIREPTASSGAEWGLSMDDDGKMWFVNSGGERGPVAFQAPIHYGAFNLPDQFEPGFETVWPAPGIGDMQGGSPRVRMPLNNLNHFTSSAAPEIVRSDRYPDMNGDLLFSEFVGRLIRRAKVTRSDGVTQLKNAYPGSEFMMSTDPLFRPINIKSGPDGGVYILDWYQGIVQDVNWTGRGTYLRAKIEQYGLDKVTNHGRIWRLRFAGIPGAAPPSAPQRAGVPGIEMSKAWPQMGSETPAQLVAHLSNPIGWWRDTAQRLLVLKQDKSVAPTLQQMARSTATPLVGRFHAMWTLEGLGALDAALVRDLLKDPSPRLRVQALRASETLYKAGDRTFGADYRALSKDPDPDIAIQSLLTLNVLKAPDIADVVKTAQASNGARGVKAIGDLIVNPPAAGRGGRGGPVLTPEQQQQIQQGGDVYASLCVNCHNEDGRGRPLAGTTTGAMMAPPLAGSPRVIGHRDYVIKTLLKGMTGPIGEAKYSEVMVPMGTNTDAWIAAVASYVRTSFGNAGSFVTPADVARVRAATAGRKAPWTLPELEASQPRRLEPDPSWKATASHNSQTAAVALTMRPWTTGAPQAPGMWFQIELPQPAMVTEIEFDSPTAGRAGGPGRGTAGAPAPPPVIPYPRGYRVELSLDGVKWGARPAAVGKGAAAHTIVTFAPARAKFIRITQTDTVENAPAWVMSNIRLYEVAPGR